MDVTSGSMSFEDDHEDPAVERPQAREHATTPGGEQEVRWEVATKTAGLAPAQIIAQRLQSEGIPARAWQEGAGRALGLTLGLLGDGYVIVPEPYLDQAKAVLAETLDAEDLPSDDVEEAR